MDLRQPTASQIDEIAVIWHEGWHQAHAALLPDKVVRSRTLDSFTERSRLALTYTWVATSAGGVLGFYMVKGDELYQLFVRRNAQGAGIAGVLLQDAEQRLASSGVEMVLLDCVIGNERAARFYEKHGWRRRKESVISEVDLPSGPFELEVWRYEKLLPT